MDWIKTIEEWKAEADKVAAALEKSVRSGRMDRIQRDIVLERLRKVYDGLLLLDIDAPETEDTASPEPENTVSPGPEPAKSEAPFGAPLIDRELIESLYGSPEINVKKEEQPAEKPAEPAPTADPELSVPSKPAGKVLNETFESGVSRDIASTLSAQMIAGPLSKKLGLNDRLMLLNDLFDRDEALCEKTLDALDVIDNIDDAYIYLYEHFTLDDSRDGVKLLISLLETKFS